MSLTKIKIKFTENERQILLEKITRYTSMQFEYKNTAEKIATSIFVDLQNLLEKKTNNVKDKYTLKLKYHEAATLNYMILVEMGNQTPQELATSICISNQIGPIL